MKKNFGLLALVVGIIFVTIGICGADPGRPKLDYPLRYLLQWTAQNMNIKLESDQPRLKIIYVPYKSLQGLAGKKFGLKLEESLHEGTIKVEYHYYDLFDPQEIVAYVASDGQNYEFRHHIETWIVHAMVHYLQHVYCHGMIKYGDLQADKLAILFYQEHYQPNLKTRK